MLSQLSKDRLVNLHVRLARFFSPGAPGAETADLMEVLREAGETPNFQRGIGAATKAGIVSGPILLSAVERALHKKYASYQNACIATAVLGCLIAGLTGAALGAIAIVPSGMILISLIGTANYGLEKKSYKGREEDLRLVQRVFAELNLEVDTSKDVY